MGRWLTLRTLRTYAALPLLLTLRRLMRALSSSALTTALRISPAPALAWEAICLASRPVMCIYIVSRPSSACHGDDGIECIELQGAQVVPCYYTGHVAHGYFGDGA